MQILKSNLIVALRRLPLFNELSEQALEVIAERVRRRKYEANEMIFSEGAACPEMLIVEAGEVKVFKSAANGREQLIAIERAGNSLAEFPVFDVVATIVSIPAGAIELFESLAGAAHHRQLACGDFGRSQRRELRSPKIKAGIDGRRRGG